MKISVDGVLLFELSDHHKNVIKDNISADVFDEDMKRRLQWVLMHKYDECFKILRDEWMPKLNDRVQSVPTDKEQLANLIFSQPDYKDSLQRAAIEKSNIK